MEEYRDEHKNSGIHHPCSSVGYNSQQTVDARGQKRVHCAGEQFCLKRIMASPHRQKIPERQTELTII